MRFCAATLFTLSALVSIGCGTTEPEHGGHFSPVEIGLLRVSAIVNWMESDIVPIAARRRAGDLLEPREQALLADAQQEFARAVRITIESEGRFIDLDAQIAFVVAAQRHTLTEKGDALLVDLHGLIFRMRRIADATGWPSFPKPDFG
jgi:hypothetical protein